MKRYEVEVVTNTSWEVKRFRFMFSVVRFMKKASQNKNVMVLRYLGKENYELVNQ